MKIDWREHIAGVPMIEFRDFFKRIGPGLFDVNTLKNTLDVDRLSADLILLELLQREWIEPELNLPSWWCKGDPSLFKRTSNGGQRLALAKAVPRIPRNKADAIVTAFLQRAEAINQDDVLTYYVEEAHVFGSYIDPTAIDFGDVDFAVVTRLRKIIGRDPVRYDREQAWAHNIGGLRAGRFGYQQVVKRLKARSPYVSIHSMEEVESINARSQLIFRASEEDRQLRQARLGRR